MKKLLSLIGTISIIGSGASTVVACGDDSSSSQTASGADIIKKKIRKVDLTVPWGTNPDTTNVATIKAMKKVLQKANPQLTPGDVAKITFSKATLVAQLPTPVVATITAGSGDDQSTATIGLKITLQASDWQKVDSIIRKISNCNLVGLAADTNPDTTNVATITAIKRLLQIENATLTTDDLSNITFSATTLQDQKAVPVTAAITVGNAKDTVDLNVTLSPTDQQKADAIKAKIIDTDLTIPFGTNPDTTNADTISAIKKSLQTANHILLNKDLAKIGFSGTSLTAAKAVKVTATITIGTATATKDLNITLVGTDQENADGIKAKIVNMNVIIGFNTNPDTTNADTIRSICLGLEAVNSSLTNTDLLHITFSKATLKHGFSVTIKAVITVGGAVATKDINVTLDGTDQQTADGIKAKLTKTFLVLPQHTPAYTGNPVTIKAIKASLQKHNPKLTDHDLTELSFSKTSIKSISLVWVTIQINDAKDYKEIWVWSPLP